MKSLILPNGQYTPGMVKRRLRAGRYKIIPGLAIGAAAIVYRNGGTVCDWGASVGIYVDHFRKAGLTADGIDGTPGITELSGGLVDTELDFARTVRLDRRWKVSFSIEVGEHLPPECAEIFAHNIASHTKNAIIISWATPNQHGRFHKNCLMPDQVCGLFESVGFLKDEQYTEWLKAMCPRTLRRRLLVLARKGVTLK